MRLIDADKLLKDMVSICSPTQFGRGTAKMLVNTAEAIDPIHAAGGCYCGECKRFKDGYKGYRPFGARLPDDQFFVVSVDDFCSYGELREAQDDD